MWSIFNNPNSRTFKNLFSYPRTWAVHPMGVIRGIQSRYRTWNPSLGWYNAVELRRPDLHSIWKRRPQKNSSFPLPVRDGTTGRALHSLRREDRSDRTSRCLLYCPEPATLAEYNNRIPDGTSYVFSLINLYTAQLWNHWTPGFPKLAC